MGKVREVRRTCLITVRREGEAVSFSHPDGTVRVLVREVRGGRDVKLEIMLPATVSVTREVGGDSRHDTG